MKLIAISFFIFILEELFVDSRVKLRQFKVSSYRGPDVIFH